MTRPILKVCSYGISHQNCRWQRTVRMDGWLVDGISRQGKSSTPCMGWASRPPALQQQQQHTAANWWWWCCLQCMHQSAVLHACRAEWNAARRSVSRLPVHSSPPYIQSVTGRKYPISLSFNLYIYNSYLLTINIGSTSLFYNVYGLLYFSNSQSTSILFLFFFPYLSI